MISSPQNGITDFIITLKPPRNPASSSSTSMDPDPAPVSSIPSPIGKIGIYRPLPSNEIGFLLSRQHWGKGLAKEALTYILRYLFSLPSLSSSLNNSTSTSATTTDIPNDTSTLTNTSNDPSQPSPPSPTVQSPQIDTTIYTTLLPITTTKDNHSSSSAPSPHRYPSITADVDPRNKASRGLLNRMSFRDVAIVERTDCIGGVWVDSVFLRCDREDWLERSGREGELRE